MAQKVERIEGLGRDGQVLRRGEQGIGDGVVGIFAQLVLRQDADPVRDRGRRNEIERHAAEQLGKRLQPREDDADLEDPVNPAFVHRGAIVPQTLPGGVSAYI